MEKVKLQAQYGLYINGEWRDASDGATYNAESPADGSHLAVCAQGCLYILTAALGANCQMAAVGRAFCIIGCAVGCVAPLSVNI